MTLESVWVAPRRAMKGRSFLWARRNWKTIRKGAETVRLHPERAYLKKWRHIVGRAFAATFATGIVTVVVVSILLESRSGRPVAETMIFGLIVGLAATVLGATGKVFDSYRMSSRDLRRQMWSLVAAHEADRTADLDEGMVLDLLVDQYALMNVDDACRFLRWARNGEIERADIDQLMRAIP
jgi:hypothetical protein